jgi:hypothetical protein
MNPESILSNFRGALQLYGVDFLLYLGLELVAYAAEDDALLTKAQFNEATEGGTELLPLHAGI